MSMPHVSHNRLSGCGLASAESRGPATNIHNLETKYPPVYNNVESFPLGVRRVK